MGGLSPWRRDSLEGTSILNMSMDHGNLVDKQFVYNGESISYCSLPVKRMGPTNQFLDSDHTDTIAHILFQVNHVPFVCGSTMPDRVWFQ
jgi:hypothetical protein